VTIPGDQAAALAAAFNQGAPGPTGVTTCPRDNDTTARMFFTYQGGRTVTIWARLTGCQVVSNGDFLQGATHLHISPEAGWQLLKLVG
jgi:hypothetical protein